MTTRGRRRRSRPRCSRTRAATGGWCRAPDGTVERVVETKAPGDATELELRIREISTGIYAFEGAALIAALEEVRSDNAQGELYLPDVVPIIRARERSVIAHEIDDASELGVNDRVGLAAVRAVAQRRIHERHMLAGVTIVDPATTVIDVDVRIGQDTVIAPFTSLHGATEIGGGARIGPLSTVIDTRVGDAGDDRPLLPHGRRRGRPRQRRPVLVSATGRGPARGREGGRVRRDQELGHRAGEQGPPPVLHRRHRHRRTARTSARGRSPPTTTARTSTARRSAPARSSASTRCWSRR